MLPGYITMKMAEQVLFIGESIRLFESGGDRFAAHGSILRGRDTEFYELLVS